MKSNNQKRIGLLSHVFALVGVAATGYLCIFAVFGGGTTAYAQQDAFLSQRLNQIEQRFISFESRLSRIEQQTRFPVAAAPDLGINQNIEVRLLKSQLEALQSRISEIECGLLKIDERTLSNAVRQQRKTTAGRNDICRQTPNEPVQLSARP